MRELEFTCGGHQLILDQWGMYVYGEREGEKLSVYILWVQSKPVSSLNLFLEMNITRPVPVSLFSACFSIHLRTMENKALHHDLH